MSAMNCSGTLKALKCSHIILYAARGGIGGRLLLGVAVERELVGERGVMLLLLSCTSFRLKCPLMFAHDSLY